MNFGNSAYGIGQRRPVNNAPSFAPIRSGGSGNGGGSSGGVFDDNFRGTQSMNYGRSDSFTNNSNNNNSGSSGYGSNISGSYGNNNNNNSQRYSNLDSKFGSMQSNNYGRNTDNLGFSNQRYGNINRGVDSFNTPPSKSNFNDTFRGQQPQSGFMGRSTEQRFNMNDNNRGAMNNLDYSAGHRGGNIDNYRGPSQQQQQQQMQAKLSNNLSLARSVSDLGYNNESNQRFYNNDRNDTFRRADNFNDNFRGQESNNLGRSGSGSNFKFNNERIGTESYGRSNNSNNFNYNNNNRGLDDNFHGQQSNNFDNNKNNQQYFNKNNQYTPGRNDDGFNGPNFRGRNNGASTTDHALVAITDTVNALMKTQSNWQVGNSNYNFGQANFNAAGNRNNVGKRNFNNSGPNQNPNMPQMVGGNWSNRPQQAPNQGKIFKPSNNRPSAPTPAAVAKFQGNRNQNQTKPITNSNVNKSINNVGAKTKPAQVNKKANNNNVQQIPNQAVAKNVNGGQKAQPKPTVRPPVAVQNTQAKPAVNPKPELKKAAPNANSKVGQKRAAPPAPIAPLTKADIKRRKLALKRGFLLGGFKLPYVNTNNLALPQPEDKSYAVMFFEQALNYSTSGEELDDDTTAVVLDESEVENKNAGRLLVKRIRKRLHHEWTQIEESKKYKSWPIWWTDYKWCDKAIQEQLETFGSINLKDCFIPDLPRLTTEQVVDVIIKQAQFGLEKNSDNYFNNMKSVLTLMNITFLENLNLANAEKVQDMIRAVPNDFWSYKMRSMIYLWAQYHKISKTASPATELGVKELQAIARDWKNPLFHWIAKQAIDELKAISEVEWQEHKQQYEQLQSTEPTS